jgi:hypothetical protein
VADTFACGTHPARGINEAWYVCDSSSISNGEPNCQSIGAAPIDDMIGHLVVETMTPAAVELAVEMRKEIELRQEEANGLRHQAVDKAQYEADLAQRRFMKVDPENRLVADTLEAEWNNRLRSLAAARQEYDRYLQSQEKIINEKTHKRFLALTADFKQVWNDSRNRFVNANECWHILSMM